MSNQWDTTVKSAKTLETKLEATIQKYVVLAQKINADYLCDEENALLESKEEHELSNIIESDLRKLSEAIDSMRTLRNAGIGKNGQNQESVIKRFCDIHSEYCSEYKNAASSVKQRRDSVDLFQTAGKGPRGEGEDSLMAKLLREKGGLQSSLRSINEVISQAFETRNSLASQRSSLQGSSGGITGLVSKVPTFQRLIEGVQRKKTRETLIVATVIAFLLCFTIWWVFLR